MISASAAIWATRRRIVPLGLFSVGNHVYPRQALDFSVDTSIEYGAQLLHFGVDSSTPYPAAQTPLSIGSD